MTNSTFYTEPKKTIFFLVLFIHIGFLFFFTQSKSTLIIPKKGKKITVRSVAVQEATMECQAPEIQISETQVPDPQESVAQPPEVAMVEVQIPEAKKPEVKKTEVKEIAKKEIVRPPPKPVAKPAPKPAAKPAPKPVPKATAKVVSKPAAKPVPKTETKPKEDLQKAKKKELLQGALSSLQKLDSLNQKKKTVAVATNISTQKVTKIDSLASDSLVTIDESFGSDKELTYFDELVSRLKLNLKLPEYGAVCAEVTLDRNGKVLKVKIISTESKKNSDYLEKALPSIRFTPFGQNFLNEPTHTFTIHFSDG